ncbi:MAG: NAD(P)-dependent oxidoreductase, partial [Candidatus Nanohaloarchaea archaeon]
HTVALMLALTRNIYTAVRRVEEEGTFDHAGLTGVELAGKTVGIVGTGDIGANVIERLAGFDVDVVAFDPKPSERLQAEHDIEYTGIDDLVERSDFISL